MHLFAIHYSYSKKDVLSLTQRQFVGLLNKIGEYVEGEMRFQAQIHGLKVKNNKTSQFEDEAPQEEVKAVHDYAMQKYKESINGSRSKDKNIGG